MGFRGIVLVAFLALPAMPLSALADKWSKEEFSAFHKERLSIKSVQDCQRIMLNVEKFEKGQDRSSFWGIMAKVVCQYASGDVAGAFSSMSLMDGFLIGSSTDEYIAPMRKEILNLLFLQNATSFKLVLEQNGFKNLDQYYYAKVTPSNFDQCRADKDCSRLIPNATPSKFSFDIWIVLFPKKGGGDMFYMTSHFEGDHFVDFGYMNKKQWESSKKIVDSKRVGKRIGQILKADHIGYLASLPWKWSTLIFDSGDPLPILKWEK